MNAGKRRPALICEAGGGEKRLSFRQWSNRGGVKHLQGAGHSNTHHVASLRGVIVALLVAGMTLSGTSIAVGAQRTVLCEEFSSQWCSSCSYAGPALDMLVDVYEGSLAFVQYHHSDTYALPWSEERWAYYAAQYTPTTVFDGTDIVVGAVEDVQQEYTIYRANHFLPAREISTDVTLGVSAAPVAGQTYSVSVAVGIEPGGVAKTMDVYVVQLLDHVPSWPTYHRNTFKQAAPTQTASLNPGESQVVNVQFTFDTESWNLQDDIKIIAWAQAPALAGPAQVYQAAVRPWPLISAPGDEDGDGVPDGSDNCPTRYNPDQADGDGDLVGDACDCCRSVWNADQADGDEDSVGDACDNCPSLHALDQSDADTDGVGDACDSCPEVAAPAGVNQFGRPLGAIDIDCDVDTDDYAILAACLAGPDEATPPAGCTAPEFDRADASGDGDVDLDDFAALSRNFTGPLVSPPLYVGASSCIECHEERHGEWSVTIHATAFNTIVASGDGDNPLCFPCHSVGFGKPSGFVDATTTPDLVGVQCENCHGPGSNHVIDPDTYPLPVNYDSDLCGACHVSCHGLCGDYHHPQYEQWSTSKHATALIDIQWAPDTVDECLACHSTDYRLAPEGDKPTLFEVLYDIECVACHSPHGGPHVAQLRLPPRYLCADCHTMAGEPAGHPDQPQSEMLHSTGGLALDGSPLEGPYSTHWWGIADECVTCHVYRQSYGGPDQPVDSGHTFLANMKACGDCHTEAVAQMLVDTTREEIEWRLDEIGRRLSPGDPLYVDPSTLSPEEQAEYEAAKFDFDFITEDGSFGAHNAPYTRELLAEAETFFGIDPWYLKGLREMWDDVRSVWKEASKSWGSRP